MSHIQSALQSWVEAVEASYASLRIVSAELEAEFARTYLDSHGPSAGSLNPQRLIARLSALESAAPKAAEAILALAHQELEAARLGRAAVNRASASAALLEAVVPQVGGADSAVAEVDEGEDDDEVELREYLKRLESVARATGRSHAMLVAAQRAGSEQEISSEELDLELLKAGLATEEGVDRDDVDADDGSGESANPSAEVVASSSSSESDGFHERGVREPPRSNVGKGAKSRGLASSTQNGRGAKRRASDIEKENAPPPSTRAQGKTATDVGQPPSSSSFAPIGKPEYQRLPRMLKQQGKLDELNAVYERAFAALSATGGPMSENDLLSACGEDNDKRIDVLRRGFSVLKREKNGWTLGKQAPPRTVGRTRPPLDPSSNLGSNAPHLRG